MNPKASGHDLRERLAAILILAGPIAFVAQQGRSPSGDNDGTVLFTGVALSIASAGLALSVWRNVAPDAKRSAVLGVVVMNATFGGLAILINRSPLSLLALGAHSALIAVLLEVAPQKTSAAKRFGIPIRLAVNMIVGVGLCAILLVVALASWRSIRRRACLAEAIAMVGQIRQAQETHRLESGHYANISTALAANAFTNHSALFPQGRKPGRSSVTWAPSNCPASACRMSWNTLPIHAERVVYGYSTVAGAAHSSPEATILIDSRPISWPTPVDDWYVVTAVGDPTGEGRFTTIVASSFSNEIEIDNP